MKVYYLIMKDVSSVKLGNRINQFTFLVLLAYVVFVGSMSCTNPSVDNSGSRIVKKITRTTYDTEGNVTQDGTSSYDSNGRIINEVTTYYDPLSNDESIYSYDGLIRTRLAYSDGIYTGKSVTTYRNQNWYDYSESYNSEDELIRVITYTYDGSNKPQSYTIDDLDTPNVNYSITYTWINNTECSSVTRNSTGDIVSSRYDSYYDLNTRKYAVVRSYNSLGVQTSEGIFTYDSDGWMTSNVYTYSSASQSFVSTILTVYSADKSTGTRTMSLDSILYGTENLVYEYY